MFSSCWGSLVACMEWCRNMACNMHWGIAIAMIGLSRLEKGKVVWFAAWNTSVTVSGQCSIAMFDCQRVSYKRIKMWGDNMNTWFLLMFLCDGYIIYFCWLDPRIGPIGTVVWYQLSTTATEAFHLSQWCREFECSNRLLIAGYWGKQRSNESNVWGWG